ncbi:phosphatidylinositol kinase- protein kinase tor1 [Coemansia sp. BCRC 34962]|nr:phosphatidylinositol kinase- protein kinase tor1 [Coemansia sp. BCRC 34962]
MSAKSLPDIQAQLRSEDPAVRANAGAQLCNQIAVAAATSGYGLRNPAYIEIHTRLAETVTSDNVQDWFESAAILAALSDIEMLDDTQQIRIVTQLKVLMGRPNLDVGREAVSIFVRLIGKKWPVVLSSMDTNFNISMDWLGNQDSKLRRRTAMLIVEGLKQNEPALLYSHLPRVISLLCLSLVDPEIELRLAAASALGECLLLVFQQNEPVQEESLSVLLETQQHGYRSASVEGLHATLLISHELVKHGCLYMQARFAQTCDLALGLMSHHDPIIRAAAISLLPRLASYNQQAFVQPTLDGEAVIARSCNYLIRLSATGANDRANALLALGSIAMACGAYFMPFLEPTTRAISDILARRAMVDDSAVSPGDDETVYAILEAIGCLAMAMGPALGQYMSGILDLMFTTGLSIPLCASLKIIQKEIGQLLPAIRGRLLNMVSIILHDAPFRPSHLSLDRLEQCMGTVTLHHAPSISSYSPPSNDPMSHAVAAARRTPVTPEVLVLALSTLSDFDFSEENLSEFVRLNVLQYLTHANATVRKQTIYAVSKIVLSDPAYTTPIGIGAEVIGQVVQGLITAAVADRDIDVRLAAITVLNENSLFDFHMGKAQNIQKLLLLLNDEVFDLRVITVATAGRLAKVNPALLLPTLRRMVTQILTEFELAQGGNEREECLQLLITLAQAAEHWIRPFIDSILNMVAPHINDSSPQLASKLFDIVAVLARAGGSDLAPYHEGLLNSIILALNDQFSAPKRMSALYALQDCISYTGLCVDPQTKYQPLFMSLARMIKSEPEEKRIDITRVIGSIGAADRRRYKISLSNVASAAPAVAPGSGDDATNSPEVRKKDGRRSKKARRYGGPAPNVMTVFNGDRPQEYMVAGVPVRTYGRQFIDNDYYIEVSVVALLRILNDPTDVSFHHMAAEALVQIFCHLPNAQDVYLDRILPAILKAMELVPQGHSNPFINSLRQLVGAARQLAIPYASSLLSLIGAELPAEEYGQLALIRLIEVVTYSLSGNLGEHISSVVLFLVGVIDKDETVTRKPTVDALHALQVIGPNLETFLFLVVPRLLSLLSPSAALLNVVEPALLCISSIVTAVNCTSFALRIVHKLDYLLQCPLSQQLQVAVVNVLCTLMEQLQGEFLLFMPTLKATMTKSGIANHERYEQYSALLYSNMLIPQDAQRITPLPRRESIPVESDAILGAGGMRKLEVNEDMLRLSWDVPQRMLRENWDDWMNKFTVELIRQSSSPALRACLGLAPKHPKLSGELFNAAFISCWNEISVEHRQGIANMFQEIVQLPDMSADILKSMLRLADLMERNQQPPFVSRKLLGEYADRCYSLAKELRYREAEWVGNKDYDTIEKLIVLNQNLDLNDSALGMLNYVRKEQPHIYNSDQWRLRLQQWDETLGVHESVRVGDGPSYLSLSDKIRRMFESSDWDALFPIYNHIWEGDDKLMQEASAHVGMCFTWAMGYLEYTEYFKTRLPEDSKDEPLFTALLHAHRGQFSEATHYIRLAREEMQSTLISHISEPYSRGYHQVFRCQMLTELEEAIAFRTTASDERKAVIAKTWRQRFNTVKRDVGMWLKLMRLHSIAIRPIHDIDTWIKFINTSRSAGQLTVARNAIFQLLQDEASYYQEVLTRDPNAVSPLALNQAKNYAYLKSVVLEQQEQQQAPRNVATSFGNSIMATNLNTSAAWENRLYRFDKNGNPDALNGVSLDNAICLTAQPALVYMYVKFKWSMKEYRDAFEMMELFVKTYSERIKFDKDNPSNYGNGPEAIRFSNSSEESKTVYYLSRLYCKKAEWLIKIQQDAAYLAQKAREKAKWRTSNAACLNHVVYKSPSPRRRGHRTTGAKMTTGFTNRKAQGSTPANPNIPNSNSDDQANSEIEFLYQQQRNRISESILESYRAATILDSKWYKAWHSLALQHYFESKKYEKHSGVTSDIIERYVVPAIHGFSRAIQLFKEDTTLQDTLRLLTVWFNYSQHDSVVQAVVEGIKFTPLQMWLQVIPQILARIHIKSEGTSRLIKQLLAELGKFHPHAILFSLYVAQRSDNIDRSKAAGEVLEDLYILYPKLVNETGVVSQDLIRMSMLPCEMWHEALSDLEACLFFQNNPEEVIKTLRILHSQLRTAQTMPELRFVHRFGRDLAAAEVYLEKYIASAPFFRDESLLKSAWSLCYEPVFSRNRSDSFNGQRVALRSETLSLEECTLVLMRCSSMSLAVPGTYDPASEIVLIDSFHRTAAVCKTKKRPRRIRIRGSDGYTYRYILKGNEDMRQDERAMQLFGLIKLLLSRDAETARRSLTIEQFPVIPLSSSCGLAGFYPNCENFHDIISDYRLTNDIEQYYEVEMAKSYSEGWEYLPFSEKFELYKMIWNQTPGDDLKCALWYKAPSAEEWLMRRTNYTRSTAVMSMTGYILGLGDRHMANMMMHERTGKIVHIDFGDCFEIAAHREQFPENIPFRLTRMITNAMELGTIEGTFKFSANHTMRVLRANQESLMAVLEAFVFDPLVSWYFIREPPKNREPEVATTGHQRTNSNTVPSTTPIGTPPGYYPRRGQGYPPNTNMEDIMCGSRPDESNRLNARIKDEGADDGSWQFGNPKASRIVSRIHDKLVGADFGPHQHLDVAEQVEKLIEQATARENLVGLFVGWMPLW